MSSLLPAGFAEARDGMLFRTEELLNAIVGEHEHQLTVKATAKSAFKASLKHLCGGKKKQSAGMPPAPPKAAGRI